jgi:hypothetical protein
MDESALDQELHKPSSLRLYLSAQGSGLDCIFKLSLSPRAVGGGGRHLALQSRGSGYRRRGGRAAAIARPIGQSAYDLSIRIRIRYQMLNILIEYGQI